MLTGLRQQHLPRFNLLALTNLLYFWPHSTAASSGLDFQEGVPDLPVLPN